MDSHTLLGGRSDFFALTQRGTGVLVARISSRPVLCWTHSDWLNGVDEWKNERMNEWLNGGLVEDDDDRMKFVETEIWPANASFDGCCNWNWDTIFGYRKSTTGHRLFSAEWRIRKKFNKMSQRTDGPPKARWVWEEFSGPRIKWIDNELEGNFICGINHIIWLNWHAHVAMQAGRQCSPHTNRSGYSSINKALLN